MSMYRNFIQDYPERCRRLLTRYSGDAQRNDLEVTLLLNIASSGLIVPHARLLENAHPASDADRFKHAKDKLDKVLENHLLESELWNTGDPKSWRFGELRDISGDPDAWRLDTLKPVSREKKVSSIVKVLRNALAHGNIFTRGGSQIDTIIFLSRLCHKRPEIGYECVSVSPSDFKDFVLNWLKMLGNVSVPGGIFVETMLLESNVA